MVAARVQGVYSTDLRISYNLWLKERTNVSQLILLAHGTIYRSYNNSCQHKLNRWLKGEQLCQPSDSHIHRTAKSDENL